MYESPRVRRLRSDLLAMERLQSESSVLRFRVQGKPPQHYFITFQGNSLARDRGPVVTRKQHEVEIKLGASYPRTMPEIRWLTPIYHPNISEIGMVCLGGYGTHWVPSLNLDELCGMLWDMARYHNYDIRSPYNREAALWVANQSSYVFPLDTRPLRDLRAAQGRIESEPSTPKTAPPQASQAAPSPTPAQTSSPPSENGSKSERYREFVRKFAEDLRSITPSRSSFDTPPPAVWEPDETSGTQDLIILDMEVELQPTNRRPPPANEEIVFID